VLKISFINVGYGDAILLETEEDGGPLRILIDGGSAEDDEFLTKDTGRIRAADYLFRLGITHLDILVCTHIHEDHVCGLEPFVDGGGSVGEFWTAFTLPQALWNAALGRDLTPAGGSGKFLAALDAYRRLFKKLSGLCPVRTLAAPLLNMELSALLKADVLSPSQAASGALASGIISLYETAGTPDFDTRLAALDGAMNNFSLALRFSYKNFSILLPGDACPSAQPGINWGHADILKLAHHGQKDSVSEDFIRAVSPNIVVSCASSDRRYNSAHPNVYAEIRRIMGEKGVDPEFLFTDRMTLKPFERYDGARSAISFTIDDGIVYSFVPPLS
jgi:competence protein ComEC